MAQTVEWFFGRGLSIGCGLTWTVPFDWQLLPRNEQVARVKDVLVREMSAANVNTHDIRQFLTLLACSTSANWRHNFHTTNWDFLLQRELLALPLKVLPRWCATTHVWHLNGTIEELPDNSRRSAFVLEADGPEYRFPATEVNIAYNKFIWSRTFVVVGMSFECEVDKFLFNLLNNVEDNLPVGESFWIILNPDEKVLSTTRNLVQCALPRAKIICISKTFRQWLDAGVPELQSRGVVA